MLSFISLSIILFSILSVRKVYKYSALAAERFLERQVYILVIHMYNLNDTMATEITLKKWGNSIAAILPKELIRREGLKENEKIKIDIVKVGNLDNIFGSLKTKITGQEFKNMVRKGWK